MGFAGFAELHDKIMCTTADSHYEKKNVKGLTKRILEISKKNNVSSKILKNIFYPDRDMTYATFYVWLNKKVPSYEESHFKVKIYCDFCYVK